MQLTTEQIEVAVDWWADVIQQPKFDNGDNSVAGGMCMMLALKNASGVSPEQVEAFKSALSKRLTGEDEYFTLGSDYGPEIVLDDVFSEAGISKSNCPWKTVMYFQNGGVSVSYGYRADKKKLLEVKSKN